MGDQSRDANENKGVVTLQPDAKPPSDDKGTHELKALLTQKERELQVHRWRGQAESDSLLAQQTLMVSCYHKIGLEYHKLRMQNENLQRRLSVAEAGDKSSAVPQNSSMKATSQSTQR